MSLSELLHADIISLSPSASLLQCAALMMRHKIGSIFVGSERNYLGIITESDLVRKGISQSVSPETPVEKLMSRPIVEVDIDRSPIEANHLMHLNAIRHLAVTRDGKTVGMISVRDLVRYFSRQEHGPAQELGDIYQPLSALVQRHIVAAALDLPVRQAAGLMATHKIGSLVVKNESGFVGIVTESDLVRKVLGFGLNPAQIPIGTVMNVPLISIDLNSSVDDASMMMASRGVRHLAVSEQGQIIGILSIRDLIAILSIRDLPRFLSEKKKA